MSLTVGFGGVQVLNNCFYDFFFCQGLKILVKISKCNNIPLSLINIKFYEKKSEKTNLI